jgi:hypothetical protein
VLISSVKKQKMKLSIGQFLVPLATGSIVSFGNGYTPEWIAGPQIPAKNFRDFMGAENGESRTNYLTLAVQAYFTEERLQILMLIVPYVLIQTGFHKRRFTLAKWQSFLSANALARFSWEAPLAQLVQSIGLDYATREATKTTFGEVAMSKKNKGAVYDVIMLTAIIGFLRYFKLLN